MPLARRPRPRRTWFQRLFLAFMVVVMGGAVTSAIALSYASDTVSSIPRTGFGNTLATSPDEGEPLNFLLIGADSVATLPPDHPLRNTRDASLNLTDTLIILRVDPSSKDASVLSIPRDLWVPISGYDESRKINSVLAVTDRPTLAQTIQDVLDIPIHNVVQVDFNGFMEVVRVIGGVEVFVEYPLRDAKAQLEINDTGCITLTPEQSLGYVRSRTLQAYIDGAWRRVDNRSDLGRIDRQQDFLVLALQHAFDRGARNPSTLKNIVDEVAGAGVLNLDDRLTPEQILDLASSFRSFNANELDKHTLPVVLDTVGAQSVVRLVEDEAQPVLDIFRGAPTQQVTRLAIRNGTGEAGLAARVGDAFALAGLEVTEATDAESFDFTETVIRFDASQATAALEVARWFARPPVLIQRGAETGGPIEVVVGADWIGLLDAPGPLPALPAATAEPATDAGSDVVVTDDPAPTPTAAAAATPTPTPVPQEVGEVRGC